MQDKIIQLVAAGNTHMVHGLGESGKLYCLWLEDKKPGQEDKYFWKLLCDSPKIKIKK